MLPKRVRQIVEGLMRVGILRRPKVMTIDLGLVHYVYKVEDDHNYYLKIRTNSFKSNKSIKIDPRDIRHEIAAIKLLNDLRQGVAPRLFASGSDFILMEDLLSDRGRLVSELFYNNCITVPEIKLLAKKLSLFHADLKSCTKPIRPLRVESKMYDNYLYWRFGVWQRPELNNIVKKLKTRKCKQLIHGDLNPVNLVLNGKKIRIFDLEAVHLGDSLFDVCFLLGHLMLSYWHEDNIFFRLLNAFVNKYYIDESDEDLAIRIIVATVYYRLNTNFKYKIKADIKRKEKSAEIIHFLRRNSLSYPNLAELLYRSQNG